MCAFVDHAGNLCVLYRAAGGNYDRDTTLLVSRDEGTTCRSTVLGKWKLGACPMSSFSLAEGGAGVIGAWETAEQVYQARLTTDVTQAVSPRSAPGTANRKYPIAVPNASGETLFAWVEGAGSLISAVARSDGSFLLVY